jgi:hypothetical protein
MRINNLKEYYEGLKNYCVACDMRFNETTRQAKDRFKVRGNYCPTCNARIYEIAKVKGIAGLLEKRLLKIGVGDGLWFKQRKHQKYYDVWITKKYLETELRTSELIVKALIGKCRYYNDINFYEEVPV